jgi:hypothetical protein
LGGCQEVINPKARTSSDHAITNSGTLHSADFVRSHRCTCLRSAQENGPLAFGVPLPSPEYSVVYQLLGLAPQNFQVLLPSAGSFRLSFAKAQAHNTICLYQSIINMTLSAHRPLMGRMQMYHTQIKTRKMNHSLRQASLYGYQG